MTVLEMIEQLQKMNPEAVVLHGDGDKFGEGFSVIGYVCEEGNRKKVVLRDKGW